MTVSAATRDKLNQWLNLKSPSGSDEQSLYDLLSLIEAYHSSFSMNTQRKLDDWLGSANDNLIGGGDGIGTTDFAKLRIATGGLQYNPWSLSSIEMQAFDEWLSLATDGLVTTYSGLVLATSPLAYWQLSEGSGTTIIDSSGNGYNGSYTGVTLGATTAPQGTPAPLWDGVGDFGNVHSAGFASAFDMDEFTIMMWLKVNSAAVWTDGVTRRSFGFVRDGSNDVTIFKPTNNNNLRFDRRGAGTLRFSFVAGFTETEFINVAISCSIAGGGLLTAGDLRTYKNGVEVGTVQTGNLASTGSGLSTTQTTIGAANITPALVWHGYLAHAIVWNRPIDAAILALGVV